MFSRTSPTFPKALLYAMLTTTLLACGGGREGSAIDSAIDKGRDLFTDEEGEGGRKSKPPKVEIYTSIARADGRYTMVGHASDDDEVRGVPLHQRCVDAIEYLRSNDEGIVLGVATLIIVMAVMNGFRQELLGKILGMNGHVAVHGYAGPIADYNGATERLKKVPGSAQK